MSCKNIGLLSGRAGLKDEERKELFKVKSQNQNENQNQTKRLWAAALFCLLIAGMGAGIRSGREFWQKARQEKENTDIIIAAVEEEPCKDQTQEQTEAEESGNFETSKDSQDSHGSVNGNEQADGKSRTLSAAIRGILRGSTAMARAALEQKQEAETGRDNAGSPRPQTGMQAEVQELGPPVMWLVSDLHYMSPSATDYGESFEAFQAKSDGKIIKYLPQILDTILDEAANEKPDVLVLTGDITMNGEKLNHQELTEKLADLESFGVQVLVIPGNHDINNTNASVYFGEKAERTQEVSVREFKELYSNFGWNQAVSRDEASFSYVYALRDDIWLMLLDTAQYEPRNLVEGMVRQETLLWMDENLQSAREKGAQVIVLGHHNLLSESTMFTEMCVLENGREVRELLESYQIPLYISGHLHLQRAKKHKREPSDEGYGIWELVNDAVSIPPCQYGIAKWQVNGDLHFYTRQADVSAWAQKNGAEDENLRNFSEYKEEHIRQIIEGQIKKETRQLRDKTSGEMAGIYADVYADYCAGLKIDQREVMSLWEYKQWELYSPASKEAGELKAMIRDSRKDSNYFILEKSPLRPPEE